MEGGMLRTHPFVADSSVLEIVFVSVLGKPFPLGCHLGRRHGKVILRPQIVAVVGIVDLSNVVQKRLERFSIAVRIDQCRESLIELMEGLEAGKDVVRSMQSLPCQKPFLHRLICH